MAYQRKGTLKTPSRAGFSNPKYSGLGSYAKRKAQKRDAYFSTKTSCCVSCRAPINVTKGGKIPVHSIDYRDRLMPDCPASREPAGVHLT